MLILLQVVAVRSATTLQKQIPRLTLVARCRGAFVIGNLVGIQIVLVRCVVAEGLLLLGQGENLILELEFFLLERGTV